MIKAGNEGAELKIKGRGTVVLIWDNFTLELSNMFYVPNLTINLISAGALNQSRCLLKASKKQFKVSRDGRRVFGGNIVDNLYMLDTPWFN